MRISTSNLSNTAVYTDVVEEMIEAGLNPDVLGNVAIQNLSADLREYKPARQSDYR